MRLFSNRSQKTSKCGKFLPHFHVICDLLLNSCTTTWNLLSSPSVCFSNAPKFLGRLRARLLTLHLVNKEVSKHETLLEANYFLSYKYVKIMALFGFGAPLNFRATETYFATSQHSFVLISMKLGFETRRTR